MSKSGPTPLEGRAAAAVQEAEQEQQLVEAADNFTSRDMPRSGRSRNALRTLHARTRSGNCTLVCLVTLFTLLSTDSSYTGLVSLYP